jgi:hypothetical protein
MFRTYLNVLLTSIDPMKLQVDWWTLGILTFELLSASAVDQ